MNRRLRLTGGLAALALGLGFVSWLTAELLWFQEVGYAEIFWRRSLTQAAIAITTTGISAAFLVGNLAIAKRLKSAKILTLDDVQADPPIAYNSFPERSQIRQSDRSLALPFQGLLPLAIGLSLVIELLLFRYSQAVLQLWTTNYEQPDISPLLPTPIRLEMLWQTVQQLLTPPITASWLLIAGVTLVATIVLLVYPQFWLWVIAIGISLGSGCVLSAHWGRFLLMWNATPFGNTEPVFSQDLGFYIFTLPVVQLLEFWLVGLALFGLLAVTLTYLLSGNSLSQGKFPGFTLAQKPHLQSLLGCLLLVGCLQFWLRRYELLYSPRGVVYGASFTDLVATLPINQGLLLLTGAIALLFFAKALRRNRRAATATKTSTRIGWLALLSTRWLLPSFFAIVVLATYGLPYLVQQTIVQPDELEREEPYLIRNIAYTRQAFGLDAIEVETFRPRGDLTATDLQANEDTIRNIRLWDTRPLLQTNRQLQQFRPYYRFSDADIDRYSLVPLKPGEESDKQQVLIAMRELDYSSVPPAAQTWLNEHLVYTHGYGFTLSPVNKVAPGGLPDYFVKDIGTGTTDSGLTTSSDRIRASIPIKQPRIYYGEIANTHVMTGTQVKELDYPIGNDNTYNNYDGAGGINLAAPWRRWLFAAYLGDWRMLFATSFTADTRILFRRNINQRVRAIAPFLRYDRDPYPVAVKVTGSDNQAANLKNALGQTAESYLYWILDAYTTSDRYPYSEPAQNAYLPTTTAKPFSYIRNSVKVVIDAYNGTVTFYVADPNDPIIRAWQRIFPALFQPLTAMPASLRSHLRYPADLFEAQAERLLTYHMTDPQVFYNREDQWQIPTEIYGSEPQLVEPYYLITQLPAGTTNEFITLLPFTPNQRTNLTAWLAARSDGDNYGKSLLYVFPKQQLVYGTEQIEARINQDPVISQQISLWNRQGAKAIQGNLLVIPIKQSLLYVEPLYLEAAQNSLPTLVRVIVAYENRIVMAETLEQALRGIFQPQPASKPAIGQPFQ